MAPFFGYHMPLYRSSSAGSDGLFDRVTIQAEAAEAAGFDLVTVMDHFYQITGVGPETEPMLEAYTTLGALAARTSRVLLGTLVTGVTYRNPALLAKQVTTLDVISGGRALLGIGAAWNEDEHKGYGFEFPPIGRRMDRLEEALKIAKLMFSEERPSFKGSFYTIDRALNSPRPVQPGGPRILVGGGGEKRTLRIAARYADITHWFASSLDDLKRKNEILERYCDEEGRDAGTIMRTIGAPVLLVATEAEGKAMIDRLPPERRGMFKAATVEGAAETLREYMDAGFTGFTFNNPTLSAPEQIARAGELKKLLS
jgi:F420-dependent oxidoreductase-like protein